MTTSSLRIALVSPYGMARFGGVRSHILGLGEALQSFGHTVEVVAPGADGQLGTLPVIGCGRARTHEFGGTQFDVAWASSRALRLVCARDYDVLHLHTPWSPAMPLQLATRFRGVRVATFHDVAGEMTPAWARALMPVASALIRRSLLHATIAVSPAVSAHLGRGTHHVIPNGVAPPHDKTLRLTAARFSPTAPVLYVGRLEPRKDVATLLQALSLLGAAAPPLLVAGEGPSRAALEALRDTLHLARVHFLGEVSEQEKWTLMRESQCVVAPSRSGESFGIVLLEAMVAGVLPIAADNPGYRGVLASGGESLQFAAGDAAALAARLQRVQHDAMWRTDMQEWAARRWPLFQWASIATRVLETYRLAMARAAA